MAVSRLAAIYLVLSILFIHNFTDGIYIKYLLIVKFFKNLLKEETASADGIIKAERLVIIYLFVYLFIIS